MKRSQRRRLRRLFYFLAFALLAFSIYLTVFHKDEEALQISQPASGTVATTQQSH
jgi:preprotein translocase subunit SecG